jgi:hypothetical protein
MAFDKQRTFVLGFVLTGAVIFLAALSIAQPKSERTELGEKWNALALGSSAADDSDAAFDGLRSVAHTRFVHCVRFFFTQVALPMSLTRPTQALHTSSMIKHMACVAAAQRNLAAIAA